MRTVLITGCTDGGIGSALAQEFNKHGYKVVASARRLEAMSALPPEVTRVVVGAVTLLRDAGTSALTFVWLLFTPVSKLQLDVTSDESCREAVAQVIKECGTLDVLVNNAGISHAGSLLDMPLDLLQLHMETNYVGAARMIQLAAPHMMSEAKRGLIINIGTGFGYIHMPFNGAYSASKHALHSMNDILRVELAPLGIDVMLVALGFIKTPMVSNPRNNPMCIPSSYGYNGFNRSADLYNWATQALASSPQAVAKRVVASASSAWGPPRHLALGAGICWTQLAYWLPLWLQDVVHGALFELWPRGRAAALMAAARDAGGAADGGNASCRSPAGVSREGAAADELAAYCSLLFCDAGNSSLSPAVAHSRYGAVKAG